MSASEPAPRSNIVSYPAPPKPEIISVPAPQSLPKTLTATTNKTLAELQIDIDLIEQGARAQIWTADIIVAAAAVFIVSKVGAMIAAHNRRPPPLPQTPFSNRSTRP